MGIFEKLKADPKAFVDSLAEVDPAALQNIITLLENLRTTSVDREKGLLGEVDKATGEKVKAATAVANAEGEKKQADDEVGVAETGLQNAKDRETINVGLANDLLTGNQTDAALAAAHLVDQNAAYQVAVGLQEDAKADRDRQKPVLNNEQAILTRVINTLEELHQFPAAECGIAYSEPNYGGASMQIKEGDTDIDVFSANNFNDKTSSIKVRPGCFVTAFLHGGFDDRAGTFTQDLPSIQGNNNQYSSFKCDCSGYLHKDELSLQRSELITTLPTLTKGFVVSFDVKANRFVNSWQSIVHFSPADENGSRQPAIWFNHLSGSLHICSAINGNTNTCYNSAAIATGVWTTVQISQTALGAYSVALNGDEVQTWQNNDAKEYSDVKVYASDPWYDALDGSIRNLRVTLS